LVAFEDESGVFGAVEEFARRVSAAGTELDRLQRAVGIVAEAIPSCSGAAVTVLGRKRPRTMAATSDPVRRAVDLQIELGEGPCLDTVPGSATVISPDVARDPRWPVWGRRARDEVGIVSVMSFLLYTERRDYGALQLYGSSPDAFDTDDCAVAEALAAHLAVAMAAGREIENRDRAMASRTVIGQAEGILMERLGISADQAFDYLRRVSSQTNRKLAAIAAELVQTRRLPDGGAEDGTGDPAHRPQ
jgi:transcriptional regulator with GAF, ATPase, and Fis domain